MARTQTFQNLELGLNIRSSLNSIAQYDPMYYYGQYDVTNYSGSVYFSLVNNNLNNEPDISPLSWSFCNTISSGSTYPITSSWANNTISASYASNAGGGSGGGTTLFTGSTYQITSSWSNNSITTSYYNLPNNITASVFGTSSWSNHSISSSYSITSSYVLNGGGSTLTTGSLVPITSSWSVSSSWSPGGSAPTYTSSLFGTSSWANNSLTASYYNNSSSNVIVTNTSSNYIILQSSTGSYQSVFYKYYGVSGSNIRSGQIIGAWLTGNTASTYTEYFSSDIGNTSDLTMSVIVTQSNVQLIASSITYAPWNIVSNATYL